MISDFNRFRGSEFMPKFRTKRGKKGKKIVYPIFQAVVRGE